MFLKSMANAAVDALFPRICPICNDIVPFGKGDVCPGCEHLLTYCEDPVCEKCGKPVDDGARYCADCERLRHTYDEGRAALIYDEYMSKSIYRFKYNGKREFAPFYARVITGRLADTIRGWNVEAIIPVPVHKSRLKKRGYNQAKLIAVEISKVLGIPVRDDVVTRAFATDAQKMLGPAERQNNLKKAFKVTQNVVKLESVLIVDDIYTTGATVDALASCLKGAGIKRVFFVSLCIGRGN
ncbi:MAG: ComF family protein [Lachnospiraceae bacterium]|nr:ComF family protein [Lachnospiraceae bacterium]MBR2530862.1 ComF family protein [Lachnospiraceae bacterium]